MGQVINLKTRLIHQEPAAQTELEIPPQPTVVEYLEAKQAEPPDRRGIGDLLLAGLLLFATLYAVEMLLGVLALYSAIALVVVVLIHIVLVRLFVGSLYRMPPPEPAKEEETRTLQPPPPRAA